MQTRALCQGVGAFLLVLAGAPSAQAHECCSAGSFDGCTGGVLPYFARSECHSFRLGTTACDIDGRGHVYLPPIYVPPGLLGYGPPWVRDFYGYGTGWNYRPISSPIVNVRPRVNVIVIEPRGADAALPVAAQRRVRVSNGEGRARSWKYIGLGDQYFAKQKFHAAYERYKSAAVAAADQAAPHIRQGHALIALGRYDMAARAFRRGMELDSEWPQSGVRLAEMYRGANMAKLAHRELLAQTAAQRPDEANGLLLVGLHLYADGEAERATPILRRAAELDAGLRELLRPLPAMGVPGNVQAIPAAEAAPAQPAAAPGDMEI